MFATKFGVRSRVLAIALVPCVALLGAGVATALYLTSQGLHARRWSGTVHESVQPSITYFAALEEERRLTLWKLAGRLSSPAELAAQRGAVDTALQTGPVTTPFASLDPGTVRQGQTAMAALVQQLPAIRQRIDTGQISARRRRQLLQPDHRRRRAQFDHGITVRLAESDYGGIRAIVLVATSVIATTESKDDNDATTPSTDVPAPANATHPHPRSAAQTRDLFSAIDSGSRLARHAQAPSDPDSDEPEAPRP